MASLNHTTSFSLKLPTPSSLSCLARRAREELRNIFAKVIRERRASGVKEEDVLQQFIDAK
jgi:hypothetical protein